MHHPATSTRHQNCGTGACDIAQHILSCFHVLWYESPVNTVNSSLSLVAVQFLKQTDHSVQVGTHVRKKWSRVRTLFSATAFSREALPISGLLHKSLLCFCAAVLKSSEVRGHPLYGHKRWHYVSKDVWVSSRRRDLPCFLIDQCQR